MPAATALPNELTIYGVAELRTQWLAMLAKSGKGSRKRAFALDGSNVEQVDAAGVQLLLSLSHGVEHQKARLEILDPSETLRSACEALGVAYLLSPAENEPEASA